MPATLYMPSWLSSLWCVPSVLTTSEFSEVMCLSLGVWQQPSFPAAEFGLDAGVSFLEQVSELCRVRDPGCALETQAGSAGCTSPRELCAGGLGCRILDFLGDSWVLPGPGSTPCPIWLCLLTVLSYGGTYKLMP